MPKVTRRAGLGRRQHGDASRRGRPATSRMTWSDGSTSSTGSAPSAIACKAATAIAGAVLRPTGSRIRAAGLTPICCNCSATRKRCSSFATTIGALAPGRPRRRSHVACSRVSSPTSGRNCFGWASRDSGHSRVPEPPERSTGMSAVMGLQSNGIRASKRQPGGYGAMKPPIHARRGLAAYLPQHPAEIRNDPALPRNPAPGLDPRRPRRPRRRTRKRLGRRQLPQLLAQPQRRPDLDRHGRAAGQGRHRPLAGDRRAASTPPACTPRKSGPATPRRASC